jgi:hypothetical protein
MTRQRSPPDYVTEITLSAQALREPTGEPSSAYVGATQGLAERPNYRFELLSSHAEPYWPTIKASFASRESASVVSAEGQPTTTAALQSSPSLEDHLAQVCVVDGDHVPPVV